MDLNELVERVSRGEDSRTQFKRNLTNSESLAGDLAAFANAKGGCIFIGVDDQGTFTGLSSDDVRRLNQLIANTATNCVRPSINPITDNVAVGGKIVIAVTVPEGVSKPYADNNGVFWVKAGADKRKVSSREELQRMFQSGDLVHADELDIEGASLDDLDLDHFGQFFAKQYGESLKDTLDKNAFSLEQLLSNLALARGKKLNLAGLLMFGRYPQRRRPALVVKAVSFVGDDPAGGQYRDSQDIEGCLRDLHRETMSFLTRNLRRLQGDQGFNSEGILEIPAAALEELVVNMWLHRDYFISAPWRVMIFDHRVELISPGALPNNLTIANVRLGVSTIRNPLIASFATKELPYRGLGTGIRRALSLVPDLQLESDPDRNLFIARIPRKSET